MAQLSHSLLGSIRLVDLLVVAAYLGLVVAIGRRSGAGTKTEDGFFLAGRKLGRVYQFFLNFGNATDSSGAVSISSLVYQNGISGVWLQFQTVLMNPYYWFMFVWYRRSRLVTTGEIFEDRYGPTRLTRVYALWQIAAAIALIGFGNFLGYKLIASLWVKPEGLYTPAERASVQGFREWKALEARGRHETLAPAQQSRLTRLRAQAAGGELNSEICPLNPLTFYCVFSCIVGFYIIGGGLSAVALNEAIQGVLIVVFSLLLLPFGLHAIGGWRALREHVPLDYFSLFSNSGSSPYSLAAVVAILFVSLVQIHADIGLMGVAGSARNEFAARFGGTAGTYAKRLVIILWALTGLLAVALYRGVHAVSDPDAIWGVMSRDLLPTGLLGMMVAGVIAGKMSSLSTRSIAISALLVRNVYRRPGRDVSERQALVIGKITIVVVLALGTAVAYLMVNVASAIKLLLLMNVPFGAAVALIFWWRRLTAPAVWTCIASFGVVLLAIPQVVPLVPAWRSAPSLLRQTTVTDATGVPAPLFFDSIATEGSDHPTLVGAGRFNIELLVLDAVGVPVERFTAAQLLTAQFYFDGLFPFAVLIAVSLCTRLPDAARTLQFYGKLKTPIGATPEDDRDALMVTYAAPARFDRAKLWPQSDWEFTRWDRADFLGFVACCLMSLAMLGGFWLVLRIAAGA